MELGSGNIDKGTRKTSILDKHGQFSGYLPGTIFADPRANKLMAPDFGLKHAAAARESAHDRESRLLMERAIAKRKVKPGDLDCGDLPFAAAGFLMKPSAYERSAPTPVARNLGWFGHRAQSMSRRGLQQDTIKAYEGILKTNPNHLRSLFNSGVAHEQLRQFSQAQNCFTKVIDSNKAGPMVESYAYFNRGLAAHKRGDCTAAVEDYSSAIARNTDRPEFYLNRSIAARAMGRYIGAATDLQTHKKKSNVQEIVHTAAFTALSKHADTHLVGSLSKKMVARVQAWLCRARHNLVENLLVVLQKPLHLRDENDSQMLYSRFGGLEAMSRLASSSSEEGVACSRALALCTRMVLIEFGKGESITKNGKVTKELLVVLRGEAMVLGGGGLLGTHLSRGDVINPHVLEYGNAKAEATVIAKTEMQTAVIHRADFDAVVAGALHVDLKGRCDFLHAMPMFQHFTEAAIEELARVMVHQVFPYEQLILDENEESSGLYIVMTGMVRLEKHYDIPARQFNPSTLEYTEIGRNVSGTMSLGTAYPGSFFAETTMLVTAGVGKCPYRVCSFSNPAETLLLPRANKGLLDDKAMSYVKTLKNFDPTPEDMQRQCEYDQYWRDTKRDVLSQETTKRYKDMCKAHENKKIRRACAWK